MLQWTRHVAKQAAAIGVGLAVVGSSGLALADGHGHGQGHGRPNPAAHYNFNNLGSATWAQPALRLLVTQGVLQGVGNGQLNPNGQTTRAQMATMLGRLLGWNAGTPTPGAPVFQDNATIPSWALAFVQQAAKKGILQGEDDDFQPSQSVTWAQAAVIIDRVFSFPAVPSGQVGADLAQLPYSAGTPGWAAPSVAADVAAGLFQGLLGQIYMPNQPISRAELAALLQRAEQLKPAVVAQANSVVVGTITAVQSGSVTVATGQGAVTVPLESSVVIYEGGMATSTSVLQAGEGVVIGVDGTGQGAFVEITSGGPTAQAGSTASGAVASISQTEISVTAGGNTTTYLFAANLSVTGAASLAAVVPGDQVTLTVSSGNLVTAIDVTGAVSSASVGGNVTDVTTSNITLSPAGGGGPFVYAFAAGGPTVQGQATSLSGVADGDQVTLTLNSVGQVVTIDVTSTSTPAPTGSVSGVLVSSNATSNQVVVLVYANNQPSLTSVSLLGGAPVTLAGNAASLGALQTGDPVSVSLDAQSQGVSVQASALPSGEQIVSGSLVADTGGHVTVANGSGQVTLADGASPVAVSGGQIVAQGSIALDTAVSAASGAANGSLLLVVPA